MVAVKEFSWEAVSSPDFGNPARQAWREAVATIAAKAHDKLPECNGRVDSAVKLVLAGDVELLGDGTAKVASQSNGTTQYVVCNGHCSCKDYERAPHNFCKHRLSAAIARRAQELVKATLAAGTNGQATPASQPAQPPAPTAPLPEAPASVNVHLDLAGRQVQLTLRDSDEGRLLARLDAILQRFPLVVKPTDMQAPAAESWCHKHGVQMRQNHKDGRTWYSHKTAGAKVSSAPPRGRAHALPPHPRGAPAMRIARYGKTRYWAVIDTDGTLVCLCVYRKGAEEVVRRLTGQACCQRP